MADVMAKECVTLVGKFLRRAVANGDDLEARDGMALAATLGGLAFSNAGVAWSTRWSTRWAGRCMCRTAPGTGCSCRS
jgi:hypothetical protein